MLVLQVSRHWFQWGLPRGNLKQGLSNRIELYGPNFSMSNHQKPMLNNPKSRPMCSHEKLIVKRNLNLWNKIWGCMSITENNELHINIGFFLFLDIGKKKSLFWSDMEIKGLKESDEWFVIGLQTVPLPLVKCMQVNKTAWMDFISCSFPSRLRD